MNTTARSHATDIDPVHTFLLPIEVIARYRWGRSSGYEKLKRPGFPPKIGAGYRLDTLMAWEATHLEGASTSVRAVDSRGSRPAAPDLSPKPFPARKRGGQRADWAEVAR